jgi:DNA-directed RNA polymerase subunit N (RpoN/RPB10)
MLYLRCPTCGELLGNIELIYEFELKRILALDIDDKLKDEKVRELNIMIGLDKYCCRMRLFTYIDLIEIVM